MKGLGRLRTRFGGAERSGLVTVAAIVSHDGVTLERGFNSLLNGASSDAATIILTGSNGALDRLLTILTPAVPIFILIDVSSTLDNETLLRGKISN